MEQIISTRWHSLNVNEIEKLLSSDLENGLSEQEARARLLKFGPNAVTVKKKKGLIKSFLLQFNNPLIYILLASGTVALILGEVVDSSVIFGVTLVNAIIGFIQESKAERAIESLKKLTVTEASVMRDGNKSRIKSADLVPGDIVLLESGDKVPADLRLVSTRELQLDESSLTGESVAENKKEAVLDASVILADRENMAHAGSLTTSGRGKGIVVATGDLTETGKIAHLIAQSEDLETPLSRKMAKFSQMLLIIILLLSGVTFGVGLLRSQPVIDMLMAVVALAVGAIPEGLPAAVTITLAIGVSRMAKRRAIIRKLPAVEALGSTTIVCSDKTGTLTENQMTVINIFASGKLYDVTGAGYSPNGKIFYKGEEARVAADMALHESLVAGILCNDAHVASEGDRWKVVGDPTEGALIVIGTKAGFSDAHVKNDMPRIDVIPFESDRQYMATLHSAGPTKDRVVYVKGSLEKLIQMSKDVMGEDGKVSALSKATISSVADQLSSKGLRVLAFAKKTIPASRDRITHDDIFEGLTLLGLQAMLDPPREEARAAISACQSAGVRVKIVTGDNKLTAATIAKKLGLNLASENFPHVVGSDELANMTDEQLSESVLETAVFARVTPEQKFRIVKSLQRHGQIVAVTGDGVNDAPALKQADIGVAMGRSGTDVAKEAADIVLTDDNFATIEAAVEEGRGVFDNIIKFIVWTLPTNLGEGFVILAAIFAGATLPISPVQILWINMTTAVLLGLVLAYEPKEPGIMQRMPRNPKTPILTKNLMFDIFLVSAVLLAGSFGLFSYEMSRGIDIAAARTIAVNVFVMVQTFYLFNCRTLHKSIFAVGLFSNRWVIVGTLSMWALQLMYTYAPFMNKFFGSAPIEPLAWIKIVAVGIAAYIIIAVKKKIASIG